MREKESKTTKSELSEMLPISLPVVDLGFTRRKGIRKDEDDGHIGGRRWRSPPIRDLRIR